MSDEPLMDDTLNLNEAPEISDSGDQSLSNTKDEVDDLLDWDGASQDVAQPAASDSQEASKFYQSDDPDQVLEPLEDPSLQDAGPREIGNPEEMKEYWHDQGNTQDCALYAQGGVLEASGQEFDIDKYREQGMEEGWYSPERGTDLDAMGYLLEDNGLEVTRYESATFQDMAYELDQGHGVVVPVDADPLYDMGTSGHAIWVTGMEVGEDGIPTKIICNDSDADDGAGIAFEFEDFKEAWGFFGNQMVATEAPVTTR